MRLAPQWCDYGTKFLRLTYTAKNQRSVLHPRVNLEGGANVAMPSHYTREPYLMARRSPKLALAGRVLAIPR